MMGKLNFIYLGIYIYINIYNKNNDNNNNKIVIIRFNLCPLKYWTINTVPAKYFF